MIKKQIYQLDLYKPSGEYAGKLDVYNLNVKLNIDSFSSISFNIASFVDDKEENPRLYDVLDNYEVVLSYGKQKHRFSLRSLPAKFDNNGVQYFYEGLSTDSELDKKLITLWRGAKRTIEHYYIPIKLDGTYEEDNNGRLKILNPIEVNFSLSLEEILNIEDYMEIIEVRESKDVVKKTPLVQIDEESEFFRRGSYDIKKNGNQLSLKIAGYSESDIYIDPNSDEKEYLLSEDLKIYYKIYLKIPFEATEDGETGKYLISDAASKNGVLSEEYDTKDFYEETYFTTVGVTIDEILGDLLPKTWTYTLEEGLNEKTIKDLKRSDLNTTNTTVYTLLGEIKKSFDVVYFIDSNERVIHFYKKYEDRKSTIVNNIVLGEGAYLKSLDKTLDAGSITTNIYGYGKDYISTGMYSPSGASWFDYSYYLDEYWRIYNKDPYKTTIIKAFLESNNEIDFNSKLVSLPINLSSRWMSKSLAAKIAIKQIVRDFIADIYLNKVSSGPIYDNTLAFGEYGILLKQSINIVKRKQKAMEDYAKLESKYIEQKAKSDSYLKAVKNLEQKRKTKTISRAWEKITENEFLLSNFQKINLYNIPHDNAQWYLNILYNNKNMIETVAKVANSFYEDKGYELHKVRREEAYPTILNVIVSEGSSSYDVMMAAYQQHDIYRAINDGYSLEQMTIRTDEGYGYNYYNFKPYAPLYFNYNIQEEEYFEKEPHQADYERFLEKYIISSSSLGSMFADLLAFENRLFITDYQTLTDLQLTTKEEDKKSLFAYLLNSNKNNLENLCALSESEEKELEKFTFDYILQDNTISNSEDLFEKVIEHTSENSKPKVSLKVNIIDILAASETTEEEKENLNLGNYVYVLFPQFNIDEKAQIHSVSINFDSNDVSIDITTAEKFSESLLHKMVSKIRESSLYNRQSEFEEDEDNKDKKSLDKIEEKVEVGDLNVSDGDGTTFSGFGLESKPFEIDYDTEEYVPVEENDTDTFDISGGGVFLEREENTEETEVSGSQIILNLDENFKINKFTKDLISNSKIVSNVFWIDKFGNIRIRDGSISITPMILSDEEFFEGFNQQGVFMGYDDVFDNPEGEFPENPERRAVLSLKQDKDFLAWNGRNLQMSGNIKANRGQIGGWNIVGDRLYQDRGLVDPDNPESDLKYVGMHGYTYGGNETDQNRAAFLAGGKNWSKAKFAVDFEGNLKATSAEISGKINAESGTIGGWSISHDKIYKMLLKKNLIEEIPALTTIEEYHIYNLLRDAAHIVIGDEIVKEDFIFKENFSELIINATNYRYYYNGELSIEVYGGDFITNHLDKKIKVYEYLDKSYLGLHLDINDFSRSGFIAGDKNWDNANFTVNSRGQLKATDVEISGNINADRGQIGSMKITKKSDIVSPPTSEYISDPIGMGFYNHWVNPGVGISNIINKSFFSPFEVSISRKDPDQVEIETKMTYNSLEVTLENVKTTKLYYDGVTGNGIKIFGSNNEDLVLRAGIGKKFLYQYGEKGIYNAFKHGTGTEFSSKIIKNNIQKINDSEIFSFIKNLNIKKFNYEDFYNTSSKKGISIIIEDELEKNHKLNEYFFTTEKSAIMFDNINLIPKNLKEYIGTDILEEKEGKYYLNIKSYNVGHLLNATIRVVQLLEERITELESKLNN